MIIRINLRLIDIYEKKSLRGSDPSRIFYINVEYLMVRIIIVGLLRFL